MAAARVRLRSFLVEAYVPASDQAHANAAGRRLEDATAGLRAEGRPISLVSGMVLVDDELALYLFRSRAAATVADALSNAGIAYDRIAESVPLRLRDLASPVTEQPAAPAAVIARGARDRR